MKKNLNLLLMPLLLLLTACAPSTVGTEAIVDDRPVFGYLMTTTKLVYEDPAGDFSFYNGYVPVYWLTEDGELMVKNDLWEREYTDQWSSLGMLASVELTEETFDAAFRGQQERTELDGASIQDIRAENEAAWMLTCGREQYFVLQQSDGGVYLARGYHSPEDGEGAIFHWLFRLVRKVRDPGSITDLMAPGEYVSEACIYHAAQELDPAVETDSGYRYEVEDGWFHFIGKDEATNGFSLEIENEGWTDYRESPEELDTILSKTTLSPSDYSELNYLTMGDWALVCADGEYWLVELERGKKYELEGTHTIYTLVPEVKEPMYDLVFTDVIPEMPEINVVTRTKTVYVSAGERVPASRKLVIHDGGGSVNYSISWEPSEQPIRVGLLLEDSIEYLARELDGGQSSGSFEQVPAGEYYLYIRNGEDVPPMEEPDPSILGVSSEISYSVSNGAIQFEDWELESAIDEALHENLGTDEGLPIRCACRSFNLGSEREGDRITVYCLYYGMHYTVEKERFVVQERIQTPAALTFRVQEDGTYFLEEFWLPEENRWEASIRELFPDELEETALNGADIYLYLIQSSYRGIENMFSWSTEPMVEDLLDAACETSGGAWKQSESYLELLRHGENTLAYIAKRFLSGGETGLRGTIMQELLVELTGVSMTESAENGQEYFDQWMQQVKLFALEQGSEQIEKQHPRLWVVLEQAKETIS